MGLDMYLTGKLCLSIYMEKDKIIIQKLEELNLYKFNPESIGFEIGYWRKANAIHKWFVDNVQEGNDDCGTYYVSIEKLRELLVLVKKVLNDRSLAKELLPTQNGFFFGGTEYDEFYFKDLEYTKKLISMLLNNQDKYGSLDLYYHSSW